jgi:hypothetical protein
MRKPYLRIKAQESRTVISKEYPIVVNRDPKHPYGPGTTSENF